MWEFLRQWVWRLVVVERAWEADKSLEEDRDAGDQKARDPMHNQN